MQGVTPVISAIIILFIAVAVAGSAYLFIQSYYGGLTSRSLAIVGSFCAFGNVNIILKNTGTGEVNFGKHRQSEEYLPSPETAILCHFNSVTSCSTASGLAAPIFTTINASYFAAGKFASSVQHPEQGGVLSFDSGTFNVSGGTIEMWIKPNENMKAYRKYYLFQQKGFRDLNDDGWLEMLVGNENSTLANVTTIYWGSAGGFSGSNTQNLTVKGNRGISMGDLNDDGYTDLLFSNVRESFVTIYWGSPSGYSDLNFQTLPAAGPQGNAIDDLDNDGDLDIVVANWVLPEGIYIYWNQAGFSPLNNFTFKGFVTEAVSVNDFNNDGYKDIMGSIVNGTNSLGVIFYGGPSGFNHANNKTILSAIGLLVGNSVADLNNDGLLDAVFDDSSFILWIYYQNEAGGFEPGTPVGLQPGDWPFISGVADLNNDGFLEIVVSIRCTLASCSGYSRIFWGSASGYSLADSLSINPHSSVHTKVADFDNDGNLDILFRNNMGEQSVVYYGNGAGGFPNTYTFPTINAVLGIGSAVPSNNPASGAAYGTQPSDYNNFELYLKDGKIHFAVWDHFNKKHEVSSSLIGDAWNHVAATWDNWTGLKLWVNGMLADRNDVGFMVKFKNKLMHIGTDYQNQGQVSGLLDEFRISTRPLDFYAPQQGWEVGCSGGIQEKTCGGIRISKETEGPLLPFFEKDTANPGEAAVMKDPCQGNCRYRITIGGTLLEASVNC